MGSSAMKFCSEPSFNSTNESFWSIHKDFNQAGGIVIGVVFSIFLVVGLPWNVLMVVTIIKEKLYKQPTIVLLLNLAVADFLMLILIPFFIVPGMAGEYIFGSDDYTRCQVCRAQSFLDKIFLIASLLTITALSIDRFIFIYKPLVYERCVKVKWMLLVILGIWLLSIIISSIYFGIYKFGIFIPAQLSCSWHITSDEYKFVDISFNIVVLSICLCVHVVCNVWVACIVQKNIRAIYRIRRSLVGDGEDLESHSRKISKRIKTKRHQKELHLVRVFGFLLGSNIVSWSPFIILLFVAYFNVESKDNVESNNMVPPGVLAFCWILYVSQVVVHPIIETTMIKDVRKPLVDMLLCRCIKKKVEVANEDKDCSTCCDDDACCATSCMCDFCTICNAALIAHSHHVSVSDDVQHKGTSINLEIEQKKIHDGNTNNISTDDNVDQREKIPDGSLKV